MSNDPKFELIRILEEAKALLKRDANDFTWSSWKDENSACDEIDRLISKVRDHKGKDALNLGTVFAPTGPMQEVSLSSGWGGEFLDLAKRADEALKTLLIKGGP